MELPPYTQVQPDTLVAGAARHHGMVLDPLLSGGHRYQHVSPMPRTCTGDTGYLYGGYRNDGGIGDGGNTILLANSYWSDFNGKDERSWQAAYGIDFATFGMPGLTYNVAYVRGTNIDDGSGRGDGTEREIWNQFKYVVQSGPVKAPEPACSCLVVARFQQRQQLQRRR